MMCLTGLRHTRDVSRVAVGSYPSPEVPAVQCGGCHLCRPYRLLVHPRRCFLVLRRSRDRLNPSILLTSTKSSAIGRGEIVPDCPACPSHRRRHYRQFPNRTGGCDACVEARRAALSWAFHVNFPSHHAESVERLH